MSTRTWRTGLKITGLALLAALTITSTAVAATADDDATPSNATSSSNTADTPTAAPTDDGDVGPYIIGGTDATETHGTIRLLTYYAELGATGRCSGTLVTVRGVTGVATNAHCVTDFTTAQPLPATVIQVQYGSTHLDQLITVGAARVEVHPGWDWGTGDDAFFDAAVVLPPAGLGLTGIPLGDWAAIGRQVRLLGWGKTTIDATEPPQVLQQLDTHITTPDACAGITEGEICIKAAANGGQACFGDSGGPALAQLGKRWVLLGSASRETNSNCTGATVYTNTAYYSRWIRQALLDRQPRHQRYVAAGAADRYMHLLDLSR